MRASISQNKRQSAMFKTLACKIAKDDGQALSKDLDNF